MTLADKICDQYAPGINLPHDICENCGHMRRAHAPKKQAYEVPATTSAVQVSEFSDPAIVEQLQSAQDQGLGPKVPLGNRGSDVTGENQESS